MDMCTRRETSVPVQSGRNSLIMQKYLDTKLDEAISQIRDEIDKKFEAVEESIQSIRLELLGMEITVQQSGAREQRSRTQSRDVSPEREAVGAINMSADSASEQKDVVAEEKELPTETKDVSDSWRSARSKLEHQDEQIAMLRRNMNRVVQLLEAAVPAPEAQMPIKRDMDVTSIVQPNTLSPWQKMEDQVNELEQQLQKFHERLQGAMLVAEPQDLSPSVQDLHVRVSALEAVALERKGSTITKKAVEHRPDKFLREQSNTSTKSPTALI